jgi:hypothetical protein
MFMKFNFTLADESRDPLLEARGAKQEGHGPLSPRPRGSASEAADV